MRKSTDEAKMMAFVLNEDIDFRLQGVTTAKPGFVQPRGSMKVKTGGWVVFLKKDMPLGGRWGVRTGSCHVYPCGTACGACPAKEQKPAG